MKLSVSLMFSIGFRAFPAQRNRDALWAGKSRDLGLLLGYCICCSDQTEVRVLAAAADKAATRRRGRNLDERGSISPLISEGTFIYLFERIPYYTYEGMYACTNEGILSSKHIICFET